MKRIVLVTAVFVSLWSVNAKAQAPSAETKTTETAAAPEQKPVSIDELPAPVKTTLASDNYKDWKAVSAVWVKDGDNEYYQIALVKDDQKQAVKLNKDGQLVN